MRFTHVGLMTHIPFLRSAFIVIDDTVHGCNRQIYLRSCALRPQTGDGCSHRFYCPS